MVEKTIIPTDKIIRNGYGYNEFEKLDLKEDEIIKGFEENHKVYKKIVEEVLKYYPLATNNDFVLYIEVLRVLGLLEVTSGKDNFVFKIKREDINKIPASESITRARRSLNSKGIGLPTNSKVFARRMKRQKVIQQYFRSGKE